MIVRRATLEDLPTVADLDWWSIHAPFVAPVRADERRAAFAGVWPAFLDEADKRLYVLDDSGRVVGFAAVRVVLDDAELDAIAIEPSVRRGGAGRKLLAAVIDDLSRAELRRIILEVRAGNVAARRLYESIGFFGDGVRRSYYENGEDAVLLEKTLGLMHPGHGP